MYDVTIRKLLRHVDGSSVLYEDQWQVKHERHAENLAAKIARDPGVQWVEIEEAGGQFKARASLGVNGIVHESLELGDTQPGKNEVLQGAGAKISFFGSSDSQENG